MISRGRFGNVGLEILEAGIAVIRQVDPVLSRFEADDLVLAVALCEDEDVPALARFDDVVARAGVDQVLASLALVLMVSPPFPLRRSCRRIRSMNLSAPPPRRISPSIAPLFLTMSAPMPSLMATPSRPTKSRLC